MCGIVGYLGTEQAYPVIIKGLKRLEYRGYDSAGIAILENDKVKLHKCKGKVADLEKLCEGNDLKGTIGIGHTRWATHGVPNDVNSHPHTSQSGNLTIIHNGIIENYGSLKKELEINGYILESETDTEVLINFIEMIQTAQNIPLRKAVLLALNQAVGAYAIAILEKGNPDEIILAKKGSPLVVGLGENDFFIASDATPFIEYTNNAVYLEDGEMGVIRRDKKLEISTIEGDKEVTPYIQELQLHLEEIEKGGYDHFMLKEIYEQPRSIRDTLRGRLNLKKSVISMSGIREYANRFENAERIIFIACGTSWHAGLVAEYIFEEFCRIPVEVEYASEFRYRNPVITENDIIIAISQSGETADTLAAIEMAKQKGATIFGICNVVGSSIARASHAGAYTHAGPEIGVASTKAFTAQVAVLSLMAIEIGNRKGTLTQSRVRALMQELDSIPDKIEKMLDLDDQTKDIATQFKNASNFLYLGRGFNFPVALEGALKLKEISYIHAEGYPAAEMKHGPIALIDENMPVVVIATKNGQHEKVVSNIQEIKARDGKIIAVINEGDEEIKAMADYVIEIPDTEEAFTPLITTVPLQLLSYHIAVMRGCNVDQPRNLAKSVTVE